MGLDSTIYLASVTFPEWGEASEHNPYMPDPPDGMKWWPVFRWHKHYVLDGNIGMGMGSPDWRFLKDKGGLGYVRAFQAQIMMHWTVGEEMATVKKYKEQDMRFIVWARHQLNQGATLLYERAS